MGIELPNIRKLFIPDPGMVICDCDLKGADAQVVAWEAEDEDLKAAFRAGLDVHSHNGRAVWGDLYDPEKKARNFTMRDEMKRATHGTNYGASPRTLAVTLGWTLRTAENFQQTWFRLHPAIHEWHNRTAFTLQTTRTITNRFGYRIVYFDRPDQLLPKALAWIPQSTIALCCTKGALALHRLPWVDVLLQVHDSVVFQIPTSHLCPSRLEEIKNALHQPIPYPDPLTIPWEISVSHRSWGEVKKLKNWQLEERAA